MPSTHAPFAFRLADAHAAAQGDAPQTPWQARDEIAIAGCTDDRTGAGIYRLSNYTTGNRDIGEYC